jgi:hypothetical protein
VTTCKKNNLGNGWRVLAKSEAGQAVIADYVRLKPSVAVGNCKGISNVACSNWAANSVTMTNLKPGAMAVGLAHEVHHLKNKVPQRSEAGVQAEMGAWDAGGAVYDALDGKDKKQADKVFKEDYDALRSDREAAEHAIRCALHVGC